MLNLFTNELGKLCTVDRTSIEHRNETRLIDMSVLAWPWRSFSFEFFVDVLNRIDSLRCALAKFTPFALFRIKGWYIN
jgi:hypothetical protein